MVLPSKIVTQVVNPAGPGNITPTTSNVQLPTGYLGKIRIVLGHITPAWGTTTTQSIVLNCVELELRGEQFTATWNLPIELSYFRKIKTCNFALTRVTNQLPWIIEAWYYDSEL